MHQNTSMYSCVQIFTNFCIFFFTLLVEKSCAAHYQYEACAPRACGGLSIRFPFYIQGLQESYCGLPEFELNCSNSGSPVIHIPENNYVIDGIFYEIQTFRVHNTVASSIRNCLPEIGNITLNDRFDFVNTSNVHILSSCNNALPEVLRKYRKVACDENKKDRWGLAMLEADENLNKALEECERNVLAPVDVHGDGGGPGRNGILDYEGLLRRGFELSYWDGSECRRCEQSGGHCGFNATAYRFWCFCPDRPHHVSCKFGRKRNLAVQIGADERFLDHLSSVLYNFIFSGISAPALVIVLVMIFWFKRRHYFKFGMKVPENLEEVEAILNNHGFLAPKRYCYSDVKKMTNSFRDKLGQGSFGGVYKGKLHDGSLLAVKILNDSKGNGEDFINEVASIGRTSHVNIVTLLGFCFEGSKRALIYEFMQNGSLEKFIYNQSSLTEIQLGCEKLFQIAVGVARGLEYLHQGCNTRILHFDIKPHNILLDKDFCPKISDFGLAKLCPNRASIISMLGARGTPGYIAPEVFSRTFGEVSHKSDVYSYGMMILEMVGGRKNTNVQVDHTSEIYFPDWIYKRLELNDEIGLQGITNEDEHEKTRKMIIVGLWCIQIEPTRRPSISRVVEMLDGSLHSLQIPPKPIFSSSTRSVEDSTS